VSAFSLAALLALSSSTTSTFEHHINFILGLNRADVQYRKCGWHN
jgi:hypothetical protein